MGSVKRFNKNSTNELTNPFLKLQEEVSHVMHDFYDLFEPRTIQFDQFENLKLFPVLDIVEENEFFKIEAEMPGMGEEDITVTFHDNRLTIEGEKSTSKKDEKKNYLSREISYGRYERTITLPQSADVDKATATFKKGMLWVVIPKKAANKGNTRHLKIEKAK